MLMKNVDCLIDEACGVRADRRERYFLPVTLHVHVAQEVHKDRLTSLLLALRDGKGVNESNLKVCVPPRRA